MLRKLAITVVALPWIFACSTTQAEGTSGPSFDCGKARSTTEKIICADAELSRLDGELAVLWRSAKAGARDPQEFLKASAQEWRIREATCSNRDCLVQWYAKRKLQLTDVGISSAPRTNGVGAASNASASSVALPPLRRAAPTRAADPIPTSSPAPQVVAAPTVVEDVNKLAATLVANKQEYAAARAMFSIGATVVLSTTLSGMMGTDSFGEKPWCLVSLPGRGPEGAKGVAKWRLVYRREKSKGDDFVYTGTYEGGSAPPRVSFDDDVSFISAPGATLSAANPDFAKRLASAKAITFKHTSDTVFTYDAQQLRLAQAIARRACP